MTQSNRMASDVEALLTMLYIARHLSAQAAIDAAILITRNPEWARLGSDEMAVLGLSELGGGLFYLADLREIPEGRMFATAVVKAGVVVDGGA